MTTKLTLYNGALHVLGERKLASLSENREPRRVLDDVWDAGAVRYCLEQGLWNFATRSQQITYDPDAAPDFGYRFRFDKPSDWVRTAAVCSDEFFREPLTAYADEQAFWFCDLDALYVRFVSDADEYGGDFSLWPQTFALYAEHYLAWRACTRLTQSKSNKDQIAKDMRKALSEARSRDAMNEGAAFPPAGSWVRARRGGRRGDNPGSSLIG